MVPLLTFCVAQKGKRIKLPSFQLLLFIIPTTTSSRLLLPASPHSFLPAFVLINRALSLLNLASIMLKGNAYQFLIDLKGPKPQWPGCVHFIVIPSHRPRPYHPHRRQLSPPAKLNYMDLKR
jgi:hypothetical protein